MSRNERKMMDNCTVFHAGLRLEKVFVAIAVQGYYTFTVYQ